MLPVQIARLDARACFFAPPLMCFLLFEFPRAMEFAYESGFRLVVEQRSSLRCLVFTVAEDSFLGVLFLEAYFFRSRCRRGMLPTYPTEMICRARPQN